MAGVEDEGGVFSECGLRPRRGRPVASLIIVGV